MLLTKNTIQRVINGGLLLSIILPTAFVQALDFSYGKGTLDFKSSINPFISSDVSLDIDTLSLAERHKTLRNSKYYYHFKLDYFDSDFVNKMTDIARIPVSTPLPIVDTAIDDYIAKYTKMPVPTDYRVHGLDFDIGLGYDLYKDEKSLVGVSVNTGISTPFMKMRNIKNSLKYFLGALNTFDTKVKTYKIGVSAVAQQKINDQFSVSGSATLNYQTGEMDNDLVGSGIDVDGSYFKLDLNLKYKPASFKKLYLTGGYTYNKWDYNGMTVKVPVGQFKVPRNMDMAFESNNVYLGVGYQF